MTWFEQKPKKHSEQFHVSKIHFFGEQDGAPERELKRNLIEALQANQSIRAAYLARVAYGDQSPATIALCLRSEFGADPEVAEELGKIFASIFGSHEHMDIIFLNDEQESDLRKVCSPFFSASSSLPPVR